MMRSLSEIKRFLLFIPEMIFFGLSYARFLYWARSTQILDPQETWNRFTKPKNFLWEWFLDNYPPAIMRRLLCNFSSLRFRDHANAISQHYDLSNKFYELFLDKEYMFYSCADFLKSTDTIEDAQENKANYILNLIDPKFGEKILDLGCGWGAMLKKIYETTKDKKHLYGYTLSTEQKKFIEEKYGFNVELKDFITTEYEPESFDKIYSIGSLEHVREDELLAFSKKLSQAIKRDGKIIHHFFCRIGDVIPTRLLVGGVAIFPGIDLANLKKYLDVFEQVNLGVKHHSVHDYRPTLKAWFDRLVANKETAIQLVGVQTYNKYLCYLAEAWRLFDDRDLMLMRFVLQRQDAPMALKTSVTSDASHFLQKV
ncbi:class I SAM-dependent methyltransferase [Rivularia sp. UHCC 0363]|uniref:class I SAM-dependent methyltransferase n=1 Tax=Rivularia sp. UHCC 0363 TaxID=3110244 RepID=UPI002B214053|nr:class I SAM-dependent methyltransferase [Rivularia sp. UHCC 0363]MEA5594046.1 class I SAM-dependent methyltransferase [Rivularia sp. UHCC 0363]